MRHMGGEGGSALKPMLRRLYIPCCDHGITASPSGTFRVSLAYRTRVDPLLLDAGDRVVIECLRSYTHAHDDVACTMYKPSWADKNEHTSYCKVKVEHTMNTVISSSAASRRHRRQLLHYHRLLSLLWPCLCLSTRMCW